MAPPKINVFVSSIHGLGLPPTVVLPIDRDATGDDLWEHISQRMPIDFSQRRYILSTHANTTIARSSKLTEYIATESDEILSLRLWSPLCGGKGGFGSQLRAAGGRMSKKKRGQGEENGSSRNLDGRRIRTVNEAKGLAEYLAVKPEMEKREREKRRERLEQIVEMAERRTEEIKHGGKGRIDEKWLEDKTEANERTRSAVFAAMQEGTYKDSLLGTSHGSQSSNQPQSHSENEGSDDAVSSSGSGSPAAETIEKAATPSSSSASKAPEKLKTFFGFDEDDEFMSSDDE
ncbi:Telomere maintenance protein SDE2 [Ceratocystis fimbriata CBS 114723]|uniref:Telomere maintenance protein SDE2 n=1 Tax=Ceratocystis fimbriata CBS 114723 TaxID=1035309 RepID=A0A2C5WYN7_9PEZI|nr:Telomere maintenance protein SDE2 [Ceratocystis fimbriata CBS 114723]